MPNLRPILISCLLFAGCGQDSSINYEEYADAAMDLEQACFYPGRKAVAVAAGDTHTCVRLTNNAIKCWGDGGTGQTGYGNNDQLDSAPAAQVSVAFSSLGISTGSSHTCALSSGGIGKCWGHGSNGKLGLGNTSPLNAPSATAINFGSGRTATSVVGGISSTCAVLDNGRVKCWGLNNNNNKLGYSGSLTQLTSPGANGAGAATPNGADATGEITGVTAVAVGYTHTCVITGGAVKCWGANDTAQLGVTTETAASAVASSPATPSLGGGTAVAIVASDRFTCALMSGGSVMCWGLNTYGQLGMSHTNNIPSTTPAYSIAAVDLGTGLTATAVSTGKNHTCAVLNTGGVKCWGFGAGGRLGLNNEDNVGDTAEAGHPVSSVSPISLGGSAISVAAGAEHSCAVLSDNSVKCWGANASGQLGNNGANEYAASLVPVAVVFSCGTGITCP